MVNFGGNQPISAAGAGLGQSAARWAKFDNDKALDIDIYRTDMTYEIFKKTIIDYADKASYPSLMN